MRKTGGWLGAVLAVGLALGTLSSPKALFADGAAFDKIYAEAVRHEKARRFQQAVTKFAEAKTQVDASDVHRNVMAFWGIGTSYEALRDCPNAIATWEEYIRYSEGKSGESGGVRNAKQKIEVCKRQIENQR